MSLKPQAFDPVPDETSRVAKAAFPNGNVYMQMRDEYGAFYTDDAFAPLFSHRGQPGAAPACLALVTVMQFAEGLSDRQAANAVRGRIDWKYALGFELTDPGFDASVLSEFRTRLIAGQAEAHLFELMLRRFREAGLLKARGQQRTDSTHVLAAIQTLNRLECVGETLRHALNVLAVVAPDWLRSQVPSEWFDRYGRRFEDAKRGCRPASQSGMPWPRRSARMGFNSCAGFTSPRRPPGCATSRPSTSCGSCGCSSFMPRKKPFAGASPTIFRRLPL